MTVNLKVSRERSHQDCSSVKDVIKAGNLELIPKTMYKMCMHVCTHTLVNKYFNLNKNINCSRIFLELILKHDKHPCPCSNSK